MTEQKKFEAYANTQYHSIEKDEQGLYRSVETFCHWGTWQAAIASREPPSISQSIRNAAINWPQYLGDVECGIIESFYDKHHGNGGCSLVAASDYPFINEVTTLRYRTFMLFVAEALE